MSNFKIKVGFVYKNSDNEFFTPAQSGNFWICDFWRCDKKGEVLDIDINPQPIPVNTCDMVLVGKSNFNYSYPEWNPKF